MILPARPDDSEGSSRQWFTVALTCSTLATIAALIAVDSLMRMLT